MIFKKAPESIIIGVDLPLKYVVSWFWF